MAFILPNRQIMLERLRKINDIDHVEKGFYEKLLQHANTSKVPQGVVLLWELALYDYTKETHPMITSVLRMQAEDFLRAIVGDDTTNIQAVLKAYEASQELAKSGKS